MGTPVNVVSPEGKAYSIDSDDLAAARVKGFHLEGAQESTQRITGESEEERLGGVMGTVEAFGAGALRGVSLGASDVALGALYGDEGRSDLQAYQRLHGTANIAGEIYGSLLPVIPGGGIGAKALAYSPAGLVSNLGSKVAGLGEAAGFLGRTAATSGGAALEGAAQNAGAYISEVALGDKELSADGFMASMGKGALWGGVAGGALSVASEGLHAARRLFPRQEVTREAVEAAQSKASQGIAAGVDDARTLEGVAKSELKRIREEHAALNLSVRQRLGEIELETARKTAAEEVAQAEAKTATAQARAETAKARLERAKAPKTPRKALAPEPEPMPPAAIADEAVAASDDTATLLERQLKGTKQGLDAGMTLDEIGKLRTVPGATTTPADVEARLNAEIAKVDPQAARLVHGLEQLQSSRTAMESWLDKYGAKGNVGKFERTQATRDYAEAMRPKEAGYYAKTPAGEGNEFVPRGREMVFRGTDEERKLADDVIMAKLSPEEQAAADAAVTQMSQRRKMAEAIVEDIQPASIDKQLSEALSSKTDDINDDIVQSAEQIGNFEAAHAELTEALGPMAPSTSQARAAEMRAAQSTAEEGASESAARAVGDIDKAADTVGIPPLQKEVASAPARKRGGLLELAADYGSAAEVMRQMGIDLPDPGKIPVIGPLLKFYLNARILKKVHGRFGGQVLQTAEGAIASKAAAAKERLYSAVDKMVDVTATTMGKVAPHAGMPAAILAHTLFDDGRKSPTPPTDLPKGSAQALFLARADEVDRAMEPGAIADACRKRIRTSNPAIVDAICAAQERKLQFLADKMPRADAPPIPLGKKAMPWIPGNAQIAQWSRYVGAAEDPMGVIERAADGHHVSVEEVETLKTVYPKLFEEAQKRIIDKAMNAPTEMPFRRRVQMSMMFDIPFDSSATPESAAFLQSAYKAPPPPPQPQSPSGPPTVTSDVRMAMRSDPSSKEL